MNISIKPIICTQCGGSIKLNYCSSFISCPYCGTSFVANYSGGSSNYHSFSNDNPIDISISETNSNIVELSFAGWNITYSKIINDVAFDRIDKSIKMCRDLIDLISDVLKKKYTVTITNSESVGSVQYRAWSYDKINWKNKVRFDGKYGSLADESEATINCINRLKNILVKNGYSVREYWEEGSGSIREVPKSLIDAIKNRQQYCRTFVERCYLEGVLSVTPGNNMGYSNGYVQRLKNNEAISAIANKIITCLQQEEADITKCAREGVNVFEFTFNSTSCEFLFRNRPIQILSFHDMGMNNIEDCDLLYALTANVLDCVIGSGVNSLKNWELQRLFVSDLSVRVTLRFVKNIKKIYKDW